MTYGTYTNPSKPVEDYIDGLVGFPVPSSVMDSHLLRRGLELGMDYADVSTEALELVVADLSVWYALDGRSTATRDADGNWEHSESRGNLNRSSVTLLINRANAIYARYGEPKVSRSRTTLINL